MFDYDPFNWYWSVGEGTLFWSSAAGAYVYDLPEGAGLTRIDSEESLTEVLAAYGLPTPLPVWPELTQRQFWKVLALAGMHEDVMVAVDAMPLEDRIEATQATTYEHDHWLIQQFRPAFGLDDSQFRDLWFWGASL